MTTTYIHHECPDCDGSGINNAGNGDCFHCRGTGTDPDERCVDCRSLADEPHANYCHALDECPHCGVNVFELGSIKTPSGDDVWKCESCGHVFTEPRRVRGDFDSRMTRAIASGTHAASVAGRASADSGTATAATGRPTAGTANETRNRGGARDAAGTVSL